MIKSERQQTGENLGVKDLYWPKPELLVEGTEGIYRTPIEGVYFLARRVFEDDRGSFSMWMEDRELTKALGRHVEMSQLNVSKSREGVIRGIHAELEDKVVSVLGGQGLSVLVDLREDSPTYGESVKVLLGDGVDYGLDQKMAGSVFVLGEGIGNSFMALEGITQADGEKFMVYGYGVSRSFKDLNKEEQQPLYIFDETAGIDWPTKLTPNEMVEAGLISKRDLLVADGGTALGFEELKLLRRKMRGIEVVERAKTKEYWKEHPVILLGGTGTVGKGIKEGLIGELGEGTVIAAARSGEIKVDILDEESLVEMMKRNPGIIFNLVAMTDVNRHERDIDYALLAEQMSIDGLRKLLEVSGDVPVVQISTDFVFNGKIGRTSKETDDPDPESVYGQKKLDAERILINSDNKGLVARISYPWYSVTEHLKDDQIKDSLWWMLTTMLKGQDVPAYDNIRGNWTAMDYWGKQLLPLVETALEKGIKIIHVGGDEASPYQVAVAIREVLTPWAEKRGLKMGEVKEVEFKAEEGKTAPRPEHGMDVSLAKGLGFDQSNVLQMIKSGQWINEEEFEAVCKQLGL